MKRIVALLFIVALAFTMISGCATSQLTPNSTPQQVQTACDSDRAKLQDAQLALNEANAALAPGGLVSQIADAKSNAEAQQYWLIVKTGANLGISAAITSINAHCETTVPGANPVLDQPAVSPLPTAN